jgi:hypothetical protein
VGLQQRLVTLVSLLGLAVVMPSTLSRATSAQSGVVGHVYVNANTARENAIAAFDRHADGMLTPLPGSPFTAGGAGTGEVIGSQDVLRVTPDGRFLLAVAAGSNEISVLRIADDGALSSVAGSPFPSGGLVPVSIAVHNDLVYVAHRGNGTSGANYTGFTIDESGQLQGAGRFDRAVAGHGEPGAVFFNATRTNLVGTQVGPDDGPSFIDSFAVGPEGMPTPARTTAVPPPTT